MGIGPPPEGLENSSVGGLLYHYMGMENSSVGGLLYHYMGMGDSTGIPISNFPPSFLLKKTTGDI